MANAGVILKLTRSNLDNALTTLRSQVATIQNDMLAEIMNDKSAAEGGDIWQGEGANNFVAEMTGNIQPEIEDMATSLLAYLDMIQAAADNVETTDNALVANVGDLRAECQNIYS